MKKFTRIYSQAVPLPLADVDTDVIIPAQFLTRTSRQGFGEGLFRRLRDQNPGFVLNRPQFQGGQVLVAERNFGCGSSREHAVWALLEGGFRAVIAPSFADIFQANSGQNGLLLVRLPPEIVRDILLQAEAAGYHLTIDLAQQTVTLPSGEVHLFEYDPFHKHCLLEGLDDLDYLLSYQSEIAAFRLRQEPNRFCWTTATGDSA